MILSKFLNKNSQPLFIITIFKGIHYALEIIPLII